MSSVPIIDISSLKDNPVKEHPAVGLIKKACLDHGFFYIAGHQISVTLQKNLENISKQFFNLPLEQKMSIEMKNAGPAWRGYFPLGGELTSGKPDMKEGLYFGINHDLNHPKVKKRIVMHGQNQYPVFIPGFADIIDEYIREVTILGHRLMSLLSLSLGLDSGYFQKYITKDPWTLFRIFHYPAMNSEMPEDSWGVGEHTDYGVLTILKQDAVGGLQIKTKEKWIEAPYIENTFICNLGDMFSKMTGGYFQATPHRVKNSSKNGRYSFPFFFDPGWDTLVKRIDTYPHEAKVHKNKKKRWDEMNPGLFEGSYGSYITMKVAKVFPDLV